MPATIISVDGHETNARFRNICRVQTNSFVLSFLSSFLFFHMLAKQTFAHVLYNKKKKGSIKRPLIYLLLYLSPPTIYHDREKKRIRSEENISKNDKFAPSRFHPLKKEKEKRKERRI